MAIGKPHPLALALTLTFILALFMASLGMDPEAKDRQRLLAPFNEERLSSSSHSLMVHLLMLYLPLVCLASQSLSARKWDLPLDHLFALFLYKYGMGRNVRARGIGSMSRLGLRW